MVGGGYGQISLNSEAQILREMCLVSRNIIHVKKYGNCENACKIKTLLEVLSDTWSSDGLCLDEYQRDWIDYFNSRTKAVIM